MNVIIAEDDATTRVVLASLIKKMGHNPISVVDGVEAWNAYKEQEEPVLMLIDWEMPKLDGLELCKRIKEQNSLSPPYLILVTGRTEPADVVEGLEQGADDYVRKPFNASELTARVMVAERSLALNQELNEMREELRFQATHDQLTGLLNRRAVIDAFAVELNRNERLRQGLHVALCDIDDFKQVNDTYGHSIGDQVLKAIADTMMRVFRSYDLVSRYGGEEFLIVVPHQADVNVQVFERLRQQIASLAIETDSGERISPTISAGVVTLNGHADSNSNSNLDAQRQSLESILKIADERLYRAKAAGKNRVIYND